MRQVPQKLLPLFLVTLFDQTSISMMFPLMTLIFFDPSSSLIPSDSTLATRSLFYGLCGALANISGIIIAPLLSLFSDHAGRKKMLALAVISTFICAAIASLSILFSIVSLLLIVKLLSGCSARSIAAPVSQAIIGDLATKEQKVVYMGYLQFIISIGAFIGPLLGGYFAKSFFFNYLNFSPVFILAALLALIAFLLTLGLFKETFSAKKYNGLQLKQTLYLLRNPVVLQLSIMLLLMQLSWSTYYQFIPPLLKTTFAFSSSMIGLFVGAIAFWLAVITLFGMRILRKHYQEQQMIHHACYLIVAGFVTLLIALLLKSPIISNILLWCSGALVPMGDVIGYCAITTLYSNAVAAEDQGKVMGLCFVIIAITWSLTALGGGALAALHISLPLLCAPSGVIILLFLTRKNAFLNKVAMS